MKKLAVIAVFLISTLGMAQDQYTKGMQKAFQLWEEGKTVEASNMFERISNAELDNWLPHYYVSLLNTLDSFGEKDKEKLTQKLEKAQEFIDLAKAISPDNADILVQQALVHTAWIAYARRDGSSSRRFAQEFAPPGSVGLGFGCRHPAWS